MKSPLMVGNLPGSEASRRVGSAASEDIGRRRKCSKWQRVKVKTEIKGAEAEVSGLPYRAMELSGLLLLLLQFRTASPPTSSP